MNRLPVVGDRYALTTRGNSHYYDACPRTIIAINDRIEYRTDHGNTYKFTTAEFEKAIGYYWVIESLQLPDGA